VCFQTHAIRSHNRMVSGEWAKPTSHVVAQRDGLGKCNLGFSHALPGRENPWHLQLPSRRQQDRVGLSLSIALRQYTYDAADGGKTDAQVPGASCWRWTYIQSSIVIMNGSDARQMTVPCGGKWCGNAEADMLKGADDYRRRRKCSTDESGLVQQTSNGEGPAEQRLPAAKIEYCGLMASHRDGDGFVQPNARPGFPPLRRPSLSAPLSLACLVPCIPSCRGHRVSC
jgi:hypothetical protein